MMSSGRIQAAAQRIGGSIKKSPLSYSAALSRLCGNEIYLKMENFQMTGSFKERGALNRILSLTDAERSRGVIAASAGNHGQGVAYHSTARGISAEIWMPRSTPLVKVTATRGYGAQVVLHGANYDEAYEAAMEQCARQGSSFIHAFDDEDVIAGQGTIGLEMVEQEPDLDVIVAPIGGGGLIAGIACAAKGLRSSIQVVGVQTARLPSMKAALEAGGPVAIPTESTLADGIAVRKAGQLTVPLVRQYVDDIVIIDEEEIAAAILVLLERERTLAEGAGAAGVAAALQGRTGHRGKKIGVVVSGGNLDVNLLARIIERGLVKDGRRLRLRVKLPDYPGALEGLAAVIAKRNANIVETHHNRAHYGVSLSETAIDITMETRGREHAEEVRAALAANQYEFHVVE
jgi:threonine dehydratase